MKITARLALIVSGICSLIFVSFCFYKGLVLYFVSKAMEDTFAGGETSDVSIFLWFVVGVLLLFFTFLFFYFTKIKDLKSQKTLLNGIILFWIMISVIQIIFFKSYFYLILIYLIPIAINHMAIKNLKNLIIKKLNEKGLSDKEIHLLQLLAGTKKTKIELLVGPPGLEPGTNTL